MPSYYEIPVIIPSYEPDEKLITLLGTLQEAGIRHVTVVDDGSGAAYASFFARRLTTVKCCGTLSIWGRAERSRRLSMTVCLPIAGCRGV
jgi:hypothetical protein